MSDIPRNKRDRYDYRNLVALLRFSNGALGIVDNSIESTYGYDIRTEVLGGNGVVKVDNRPEHMTTVRTHDNIKVGGFPWYAHMFQSAYLAELSSFAGAILKDSECAVTTLDGTRSILLSICADVALRTGNETKLPRVAWI